MGAGKQSRKNAVALLKDFIGSRSVEIFVLATPFDDSARFAADFALMAGIPVTLIHAEDSTENFGDYSDAKVIAKPAGEEVSSLQTVLQRGTDSNLLFAFAETDEEEDIVKGFLTAGVSVLDFAEGLYPVTLEDDGVPDATQADTAAFAPAPDEVKVVDPPTDGLEPETVPDLVPDEAQQPAVSPKARAPRKAAVKAEPVQDVPLALDTTLDVDREAEALGAALRVILDYLKK